MLALSSSGKLTVKLGWSFTQQDAMRIWECLSTFAPISVLVLDLRGARALQTDALITLARAIHQLQPTLEVLNVPGEYRGLLAAFGIGDREGSRWEELHGPR